MDIVTGVDIGGSHISCAQVDLAKKEIVPDTLCRKAVNSKDPADVVIEQWCECIQESQSKAGVSGTQLGIAIPAPFDYDEGICLIKNQDKFDLLYNVNIKTQLAERLGIERCDIAMQNDASCFMLGEMIVGAGKDFDYALGVTLGTGLGSASAKRMNIQDAGLWNTPFRDSIAEEYISNRWFLNSYFERSGLRLPGVKELAKHAEKDSTARDLFIEFGDSLGQFIEIAIEQVNYNPQVIILGGNIAKSNHLFLDATQTYLSNKQIELPIKIAELGELSAIYGAAGLWKNLNFSGNSLPQL